MVIPSESSLTIGHRPSDIAFGYSYDELLEASCRLSRSRAYANLPLLYLSSHRYQRHFIFVVSGSVLSTRETKLLWMLCAVVQPIKQHTTWTQQLATLLIISFVRTAELLCGSTLWLIGNVCDLQPQIYSLIKGSQA